MKKGGNIRKLTNENILELLLTLFGVDMDSKETANKKKPMLKRLQEEMTKHPTKMV